MNFPAQSLSVNMVGGKHKKKKMLISLLSTDPSVKLESAPKCNTLNKEFLFHVSFLSLLNWIGHVCKVPGLYKTAQVDRFTFQTDVVCGRLAWSAMLMLYFWFRWLHEWRKQMKVLSIRRGWLRCSAMDSGTREHPGCPGRRSVRRWWWALWGWSGLWGS